MKEIRPHIVIFFILGVLLLLLPIALFFPDSGWTIGNQKLKFLSLEHFANPPVQEKKDITNILENIDTTMVADNIDSLVKYNGKSTGDLGEPSGDITHDKTLLKELQFNEKGKENLFRFFEILSDCASLKKKISILHYGDSQIEGDRMTSYIRQKIQLQFGGYGPGLIPATNVYNTFTFKQRYSDHWTRYTAFGGEKLISRKYGALASASRFTPEYDLNDSTFVLDSLPLKTAWIEISPSKIAYSRARKFNHVRLHYNDCVSPTRLRVYNNDALIHEEELITDGKQHTFSLSFPGTPEKLKYEFSGKISPNICGFSLEGDYGVQVANIAMRGSSGTVFNRIKNSTLKPMYHELNTQLVIMQFGGNSVIYFKDSSDVTSYANWFKSQIKTVQKTMPGSMVVVIGPSDMSKLEDGIYTTYPFLPYCTEEMKRVSLECGAAFWNLYAAMGGQNSMPSWVEQGLAGKDYIHFTNKGAKFASQMFYNSFISQYIKWKSEKK